MSERGIELLETTDGQIPELIDLLSARGAVALSLPSSGREKLGDSTVAALARCTQPATICGSQDLSRPQVRCPGRMVARATWATGSHDSFASSDTCRLPKVHTTMASTTAAMQRSTPI